VYNRLTQPIALTLEDSGYMVPAGDSLRLPLTSHRPLEAHWAMVRPAAGDGRMLGSELEGSIVTDDPKGELREIVAAGANGRPRFSPVVVNATGRRLRVAVVSGSDTTDCGCSIAPGDSLNRGYYPLVPGSGIRVHDGTRAAARFDPVLVGVDSTTGAVIVRVTPASLTVPAAPTRRGATRAREEGRSQPFKTFLPVR
jgi:hypothetical protein